MSFLDTLPLRKNLQMNQRSCGYRISSDYGYTGYFFRYQRPKGRAKNKHVTYVLLQSFTSSSQRTSIYEQRIFNMIS